MADKEKAKGSSSPSPKKKERKEKEINPEPEQIQPPQQTLQQQMGDGEERSGGDLDSVGSESAETATTEKSDSEPSSITPVATPATIASITTSRTDAKSTRSKDEGKEDRRGQKTKAASFKALAKRMFYETQKGTYHDDSIFYFTSSQASYASLFLYLGSPFAAFIFKKD